MAIRTPILFFFFLLLQLSCKSQKTAIAYTSETLKIIPVTKNSFVHVSYLETDNYGKVACNGLIYMNEEQAVVFDSPVDDTTSEELIRWINNTKKHKIMAVVINHFHDDCLGGLAPFHRRNIPSYANEKTIVLAKKEGNQVPKVGFDSKQELTVGNRKISNKYIGEAHTKDNIVSYIPSEKLLFGGCMVKSLDATKGYLGDANESEWSMTIEKIKQTYPDTKIVIPGHGDFGGTELLDYTAKLFSTASNVNNN